MRLLGKIDHLMGNPISEVSLSDYGEPLLSKVWNELLAWALSHRGLQVSFTTNGILLGRHIEESIDPRISIAVSMDGATEETYGYFRGKGHFSRLLENLKVLKKVKESRGIDYPSIVLFIAVSRINCRELPQMVELAKEVGAVALIVQFQLFFERGRLETESVLSCPEEYNRYIAAARKRAAELGVFLVHPDSFDGQSVIPRDSIQNAWLGRNPDGSIRCFAQLLTSYIKFNGIVEACCAPGHLVMGDLSVDSFEDIWHGPSYRALRLAFDRGVWPQSCSHCNLIQSVDSCSEQAHFIPLDGVSAEGVSIRQGYRITEIERIYGEALTWLPDHAGALAVLAPIMDIDENLYEVKNLAACLCGMRGDLKNLSRQLERCSEIAPRDSIIVNNNTSIEKIRRGVGRPSGTVTYEHP